MQTKPELIWLQATKIEKKWNENKIEVCFHFMNSPGRFTLSLLGCGVRQERCRFLAAANLLSITQPIKLNYFSLLQLVLCAGKKFWFNCCLKKLNLGIGLISWAEWRKDSRSSEMAKIINYFVLASANHRGCSLLFILLLLTKAERCRFPPQPPGSFFSKAAN